MGVGVVVLNLLGDFDVVDRGVHQTLPPAGQRVLAFCAVHGDVKARSAVAGRLWPDMPEDEATRRLRTALWRIGVAAPTAIVANRHSVRLSDTVRVDLIEGRRDAARIAIARSWQGADRWIRRFSNDLLPAWDYDWLTFERERWRQVRLHALEETAWGLGLVGRYAEAVETALIAIDVEPLRESAHRMLVRLHLAEGNVSEARRQAALYTRMSRAELGLEPSAAMRGLVAQPHGDAGVTPR